MSLSRVSYTAGAGQTDFTITFDYITESYVEVYVDGVIQTVTTDYTFFTATMIRLVTPTTGGEIVQLIRNTKNDSRLVDFQDAGNLTEADLDLSADQNFHLMQENIDNTEDYSMRLNTTNEWDAEGNKIINVADPALAQDAATKNYVDTGMNSQVVAAAASAADAANTYDEFDDRYLGSKASAPTLDNDGDALLEGALYWNSTSKDLWIYNGSTWELVSSTLADHYTKTETDNLLLNQPGSNLINNGDFQVWQRGISFTGNGYTADMWFMSNSTSAVMDAVRTELDASAAVAEAAYGLRYTVTTPDPSIGTNFFCALTMEVEAIDVEHLQSGQSDAKEVTLHFAHKHTVPGTYCVAILNSSSDRHYIAEYTQSVGGAWETSDITFTCDTSGTWASGVGEVGFRLYFVYACGSALQSTAGSWQAGFAYATSNQVNGVGSVSDVIEFANVKLEVGSRYTGRDVISFAQALSKAERHYEVSYDYGVPAGTVTSFGMEWLQITGLPSVLRSAGFRVGFRTQKAVTPTVTVYSPVTGAAGSAHDGAAPTGDVAASVSAQQRNSFRWSTTTNGVKADLSLSVQWVAIANLS